jgi:nucleotide-binding universal stress UspA family protein
MTGTQIVVGVDYSPASDAALAWALDAASRRQAELRIVHVCELSQRQLEALGESATRLRGQARDRGQRLLDDAVRIAGKTHPDVRVTPPPLLGIGRATTHHGVDEGRRARRREPRPR